MSACTVQRRRRAARPTAQLAELGFRDITLSHSQPLGIVNRASPCAAIAMACINGRLHCSSTGMLWPVCGVRPGGAAGMTGKAASDPSPASRSTPSVVLEPSCVVPIPTRPVIHPRPALEFAEWLSTPNQAFRPLPLMYSGCSVQPPA